MSKIKYKNYNILDFKEIQNPFFKLCVGVIGYLFVVSRGGYDVSYIPASFIKRLESKYKNKIIEFLIDNKYIDLLPSTHKNTQYYIATGLTKPEKQDAHLYKVNRKLLDLYEVILYDDLLTKWIDEHLHLLNGQYMNHYNSIYKYIKIDLPQDVRERYSYNPIILNVIDEYGDPTLKDYYINRFGFDNNKFAGEHLSLFTKYRELLHYTSIVDPWEVGFYDSIPLVLADQLLKTIGKNDFSSYYRKGKYSKSLFKSEKDYDIFDEIYDKTFYSAIFGYDHIEQFQKKWPKAYDKLYQIKSGRSDIDYFLGFASNIKPKILKSDVRLKISENHPAFKRGQAYYKIVPLVIRLRIVNIMRDVWKRMKKCDIPFIPLFDSVLVPKVYNKVTYYIFYLVLKEHIDDYLRLSDYSVPLKMKYLFN